MAAIEEDGSYLSEEDTWSQGESLVFSDEGADYEAPPWPGDDYSSSDFEEEPEGENFEPEPPDYSHDNISYHSWSREEEADQEEGHEETDSQFSLGKGNHDPEAEHGEFNDEDHFVEPYTHGEEISSYHEDKPWCEETDSQISFEETKQNGEELEYQDEYAHESEDINEVERWEQGDPGRGDMEPEPPDHTSPCYTYQTESNQGNSCENFDFQLITFSGHKQGPEAYINWERELEYWFRFHNIPKEERLATAVNSLVGDAFSWWISEEFLSHYNKPILTWGDLKQRMYREFVQRVHNQSYTPKRLMFQKFTREAEKPIQVKEVQQKSIPIPSLEPQGKSLQGKSSNSSFIKLKEPTCYRCHKRGHFAATCPERKIIKSTSLEHNLNLSKLSDCLDKTCSNSSIMHLSLPKVDNAGFKHDMEQHLWNKTCQPAPEKNGVVTSFSSIQEEPPDYIMKAKNVVSTKTEQDECHDQVSKHILNLSSNDFCYVKTNLLKSDDSDAEKSLVLKPVNKITPLKLHFNENLFRVIEAESCFFILKHSMTAIIHLSLPKSFYSGIRQEEEHTSQRERLHLTCQKEDVKKKAEPILLQLLNSITVSLSITKPNSQVLNSHMMHLSLFLDDYSGIKQANKYNVQDEPKKRLACSKTKDDERRDCLKEKPPDQLLHHFTALSKEVTKTIPQVSCSFTNIVSRESEKVLVSLLKLLESDNLTTFYLQQDFDTTFKFRKEHLIHLFLVQSVEVFEGINTANGKEIPPAKPLLLKQSRLMSKKQKNDSIKGENATVDLCWKSTSITSDTSHGVIQSYLLKGDPPHVPPIAKPKILQGKTISSKKRMNTNLLYLGAGDIVSRSKPFQEGEYDEDIKSSSTKEHGTRRHEEENMKLRKAKKTGELSSAQMEAQTEDSNLANTWRIYSTRLEFHTKKNQLKMSSYEEDIEDTTWKIFNELDGDLRPLINLFRPNQDEPGNKSNCFGFSTHQRKTENWTHGQIHFGSRVIDFTIGVNRNFPGLDIGALIGGFRPNQKVLRYESTCFGILTQPGRSSNWFHTKLGSDVKVIQLLSQRYLDLPYMEAFTLGSITLQRLYSSYYCDLSTDSLNLDVTRQHTFTPKLSRIKHIKTFPFQPKTTIQFQRPYELTFSYFISLFELLER